MDRPAIAYGAPGPEDDTRDGYAGELPGLGAVTAVGDAEGGGGAAASDGGEAGAGRGRTEDAIPPWCDPAHPMGAWLNYQNIQVGRQWEELCIALCSLCPGLVYQPRLHPAQPLRRDRGAGRGRGEGGGGGGGGGGVRGHRLPVRVRGILTLDTRYCKHTR